MAGTMLAAETIKLLLGQPRSPHLPEANNVTFQFLKPAAMANAARILARDPACPACPPTSVATLRWQFRYEQGRFPRTHGLDSPAALHRADV